MATRSELDAMQMLADCRTVRKIVRGAGIGSVLFGLVAIFLGLLLMLKSILFVILAVIGLALLAAGVVNLVHPTPFGIIVEGVTLLTIGAWNIVLMFIVPHSATTSRSTIWPVIGAFQIWYAVMAFGRYKRFARTCTVPPSEEALRQVDALLTSVARSNAARSEDMVEFLTTTSKPQAWKGRLMSDRAVFVVNGGQDARVLTREDISVTPDSDRPRAGRWKAAFKIGADTLKGSIDARSMERLERWREIPVPMETGEFVV